MSFSYFYGAAHLMINWGCSAGLAKQMRSSWLAQEAAFESPQIKQSAALLTCWAYTVTEQTAGSVRVKITVVNALTYTQKISNNLFLRSNSLISYSNIFLRTRSVSQMKYRHFNIFHSHQRAPSITRKTWRKCQTAYREWNENQIPVMNIWELLIECLPDVRK